MDNRPKIIINLDKIYKNVSIVIETLSKYNVDVSAVTKMHGADIHIVDTLYKAGIRRFGDSRLENLMNIKYDDAEKWLIRLPSISRVSDTVKYSTCSLISQKETAYALNEECIKQGKDYECILMADIGDLREGCFEKEDLLDTALYINSLSNIKLKGIGTNLTCYGGVLPSEENLSYLVSLKDMIEDKLGISLEVVSGGNSTSYTLFREDRPVNGITNLRIGDTLYLGRDCTYRKHIDSMIKDAFILEAEIIEIKDKPSIPIGKRGMSALNTKAEFVDRGIRKRAILSVGKQDIDMDIFPLDEDMILLGGSSDHLIVDITDSKDSFKIGDSIRFYMYYTSIMRGFTSKYITKEFINE